MRYNIKHFKIMDTFRLAVLLRYVLPFVILAIVLQFRVLNLIVNPNHELWRLSLEPVSSMGQWNKIKAHYLKIRGAKLGYVPPKVEKEKSENLSTLNMALASENKVILEIFCKQITDVQLSKLLQEIIANCGK